VGVGVVNRKIAVHHVERVECMIEENPAREASALEFVFAFTNRAIVVVGGVIATAGGAVWGEVLATLAGCALSFRSGAGACIRAVRL
jgi:hypothetical protein